MRDQQDLGSLISELFKTADKLNQPNPDPEKEKKRTREERERTAQLLHDKFGMSLQDARISVDVGIKALEQSWQTMVTTIEQLTDKTSIKAVSLAVACDSMSQIGDEKLEQLKPIITLIPVLVLAEKAKEAERERLRGQS